MYRRTIAIGNTTTLLLGVCLLAGCAISTQPQAVTPGRVTDGCIGKMTFRYCPSEPACYGYHPTYWTAWPGDCESVVPLWLLAEKETSEAEQQTEPTLAPTPTQQKPAPESEPGIPAQPLSTPETSPKPANVPSAVKPEENTEVPEAVPAEIPQPDSEETSGLEPQTSEAGRISLAAPEEETQASSVLPMPLSPDVDTSIAPVQANSDAESSPELQFPRKLPATETPELVPGGAPVGTPLLEPMIMPDYHDGWSSYAPTPEATVGDLRIEIERLGRALANRLAKCNLPPQAAEHHLVAIRSAGE